MKIAYFVIYNIKHKFLRS